MRTNDREREEINWMIAQEIPALRRYARLLLRSPDKDDDLVQDTLERAIKKSHTWRREGNIRSWLYRIQYTVFLNRYRKTGLKEITDQDITEGAAGAEPATQEKTLECRRVMEATQKLKPRQREVLLLVAVEGFSYDEAARIMDIPVGTIRSRLARAREELRGLLERPATAGAIRNNKQGDDEKPGLREARR